MRPFLLLLLAVCSACSSARVFFGSPRGGVPPFGTPQGDPTATNDGIDRPTLAGPQMRRICRGEDHPQGWVIIEYVAGAEACARGNWDPRYSAAVILWIGDQPVGTRVTICSDQTVPSGWTRVADNPEKQCPGAAVVGQERTSLVIERQTRAPARSPTRPS